LTDVRTGYHVWAERFDRLLEDILDLQEEVARNIVEALRLSLTESEKAALAKRPTDDLRAYDFYMRGQDLVSRRGRKNAEQAVQMLERALAIDPSFVRAHSALAEACAHIFAWYDGDPKWLARIIEVSEKALVLEPGSLQARLALGTVYVYQKRFDEAKRAFESVVRERPDFYEATLWLGMVFHRMGEHDAAIRCFMRANELKPYSEEPWIHLDMSYRRKGDLASSEAANRRILETGSRRLELDPDDTITRSRVACAYARSGEREKALAEVRDIREADPTDGLALYNVACALAELGEKTEMLACLRIAFAGGQVFHDWAHTDPDFHAYWADEGFRRLVEEFD
jgi:tetratricopeptide (TPR) repeat protein